MLIKTGKLPDVITLVESIPLSAKLPLEEQRPCTATGNTGCKISMPDLVVPQSMIDWYRNKDGHWYSIASFYYGEDGNVRDDNNGCFRKPTNWNFVRDDILKQIGMTYDELRTKRWIPESTAGG